MTPSHDTRSAILESFRDQLSRVGYPGISLAGVAKTAGVQKPSLYHHFPSGKEEIYQSVATVYIEALGAEINQALSSSVDFREQLQALIVPVTSHASEGISFEQRIYDSLNHVSETVRDEVSQLYVERILDPVTAAFSSAVADGIISGDAWFLTNSFLHMAKAIEMTDRESGPRQLVDLFMNGAALR